MGMQLFLGKFEVGTSVQVVTAICEKARIRYLRIKD
jgi:hypothetical protein